MKRSDRVIVASIVLLILVATLSTASRQASLTSSSILPSFEGPHADIFGFQPVGTGTVYTVNNPGSFSWVQSTSGSGQIGTSASPYYSWQYTSEQTAITECNTSPSTPWYASTVNHMCVAAQVTSNNPYTSQSGFSSSSVVSTINYWVRDPSNSSVWIQVAGQVVLYNYQLTISVQPGSDPNYQFKGDTVWVRLYSTTWNNYQFNPANTAGLANGTLTGAWSAPLLLVLANGKDLVTTQTNGYATNDNTIPDYHNSNAPQTLYSAPKQTTVLPSMQPSSVNSTLASGGNLLAPDTSLSQYAYFPLVLSDVGSFLSTQGCIIGATGCQTAYPDINLSFQLYELQLGRYLWTNPVHHPLGTSPNNSTGQAPQWLQDLGKFFASPYGQLLAIVIVVAVLVVAYLIGKEVLKLLI